MTSKVNADHNSDNNKDNGCSYKICLYNNLKLENCATKNCFNKLHHLCQNNIDNVSYDGGFEKKFGCTFCCSECIGKRMKNVPPYCHDLFDSETSEYGSTLFPDDCHGSKFENNDFPFFNLKGKYFDDYNVAMQHLEEYYSFSKIDYKMFHPNLIRNNDHIEFHQKNHCDFTIDPSIVLICKKKKH